MGMSSLVRQFSVEFRHQVHFTDHVFDQANSLLVDVLTEAPHHAPPKVLIVIDDALAKSQPAILESIQAYFDLHQTRARLVCPPMSLEGGERVKNSYFRVTEIHSAIDKFHLDRHSYLIAIGGGALLDMAGLAAATAHRGVRHIRIPTTTLSQDDSGVGVKNGVNAFGKKNFIGTFAPPYAVINDFRLLDSLPDRDKRNGYVEAVKVALIRDAAFFEEIEQNALKLRGFDETAMRRLIHRCAELHMTHIATSGDPFEIGSARPLDFGHWAAHKLEQLSEYRIRHGEAVAIGIALDVIYCRRKGLLDHRSAERILNLLEVLGFELFANELVHVEKDGQLIILKGLEEFREHLGGMLTITLLTAIGRGVEVHEMDMAMVVESMNELERRHQQTQSASEAV